jgi:integrase
MIEITKQDVHFRRDPTTRKWKAGVYSYAEKKLVWQDTATSNYTLAQKYAADHNLRDLNRKERQLESADLIAKRLGCEDKETSLRLLCAKWYEWLKTGRATSGGLSQTRNMVRQWLRYCGIEDAESSAINPECIHQFVNDDSRVRAATRSARYFSIRNFCDWMHKRGFLQRDFTDEIRVDMSRMDQDQLMPVEPRVATEDDLKKLLAFADKSGHGWPKFFAVAAHIAWHTGLRYGDIATLEWSNINFERGLIRRVTRKRSKYVEVEAPPEVMQLLVQLRADSKEERFVFPTQATSYRNPDTSRAWSSRFAYVSQTSGVGHLGFHAFRRAYCQRRYGQLSEPKPEGLFNREALAKIAKEVGHSSINQTLGYMPQLTRAAPPGAESGWGKT